MNVKDISGKKFEKSAFGYKTDDVDDFLRDIGIEMAQLQKEVEDAEKKNKVLADKVLEYRQDEDALKDALLGAQRQGHKVLEEAQIEASKILDDARENAKEIAGDIEIKIENEKIKLANMQKEVSDFKANLLALYKSHLDLITAMPEAEEQEDDEDEEDTSLPVDEAASEVTEDSDVEDDEESNDFPFSTPVSSTAESRYGELKFGQKH